MNPEGESRYVDMPGNIVDGQIIFEQEKQKYTDRGMYRGELKDISFEMDMVGMKQTDIRLTSIIKPCKLVTL